MSRAFGERKRTRLRSGKGEKEELAIQWEAAG